MPNNFHSTSQLMEHEFVQHTSLIYKIITINFNNLFIFFSNEHVFIFFYDKIMAKFHFLLCNNAMN
jgi:hypothetical protein